MSFSVLSFVPSPPQPPCFLLTWHSPSEQSTEFSHRCRRDNRAHSPTQHQNWPAANRQTVRKVSSQDRVFYLDYLQGWWQRCNNLNLSPLGEPAKGEARSQPEHCSVLNPQDIRRSWLQPRYSLFKQQWGGTWKKKRPGDMLHSHRVARVVGNQDKKVCVCVYVSIHTLKKKKKSVFKC